MRNVTNFLENNLFRKNLHNAAIFTIYVGARFGDYRYGFKIFTHKLRNLSDPAEGKEASLPLNSESYRAVLPRKKDCSNALHHHTKTTFEEIRFWPWKC